MQWFFNMVLVILLAWCPYKSIRKILKSLHDNTYTFLIVSLPLQVLRLRIYVVQIFFVLVLINNTIIIKMCLSSFFYVISLVFERLGSWFTYTHLYIYIFSEIMFLMIQFLKFLWYFYSYISISCYYKFK